MPDKYTEEKHAKRLLKMLTREDVCECCPAVNPFKGWNSLDRCVVCTNFIGINNNRQRLELMIGGGVPICPCNRLGAHEAIKRTWLALEEKGYLD